jgi:pyrroloquinoline quinone (PQQ) biosynthesis protein C
VQEFVKQTFAVIAAGQPHAVAAAFTFGREDVIPDMFRHLVADLGRRFPGQLDTFIYYLNRHIELDEENHAPLAQQMVRDLCGTDPARWQQATEIARQGMAARVALWNGIQAALAQEPATT